MSGMAAWLALPALLAAGAAADGGNDLTGWSNDFATEVVGSGG
jgi:hypothetical protein